MKVKNKQKQPKKQPPKQKVPFTFWVRGPNGKPSISATFATVSFFTTTAVYIISIFEKIGPYAIRPFDAAACGIYLVPIMSLYFGRRWTDSRFASISMNQYEHQNGSRNNQRAPRSQQRNTEDDHDDHSAVDEDDSQHFKGVVEEGSDEDNSK